MYLNPTDTSFYLMMLTQFVFTYILLAFYFTVHILIKTTSYQ